MEQSTGMAHEELEMENAESLHVRGSSHLEKKQYSLAVTDLLRSVELAPYSAKTWNNLGAAYAYLGNLEHACEAFGRAAGIDPEPLYLNNLAHIHMLLGNTQEASLYRAMAGDFVTAACPYLPDRYIRFTECVRLEGLSIDEFDVYLQKGFRRIGGLLERNVCAACSDCVQLRVPVAEFVPNRAQRRNLGRNSDLTVRISESPELTIEKVELFRHYMQKRHQHNEDRLYDQEMTDLYTGWGSSVEISYYLKGRLAAVGLMDEGREGAYLPSFFYHLDMLQRGPGVYNIMTAIRAAAERGRRFLYFGETIDQKDNMRYKRFFRPHDTLDGFTWVSHQRSRT